jgi:hypothetical protein
MCVSVIVVVLVLVEVIVEDSVYCLMSVIV